MKYFETYFRIKSAYQGIFGFGCNEQKEAFYEEVATTFTNDGWEIIRGKSSGCADSVRKNRQDLYLHPMYFSGVVCEDSIEHLNTLLSADTLQTFRCYHLDVHTEYKDMTDDEYLSLLYAQENEIEEALLAACQTKRKNLYAVGNMVECVAGKFSVPRLGQSPRRDKENIVVREVFNRLTRTGAIEVAQTKRGVGYRTIAKSKTSHILLD